MKNQNLRTALLLCILSLVTSTSFAGGNSVAPPEPCTVRISSRAVKATILFADARYTPLLSAHIQTSACFTNRGFAQSSSSKLHVYVDFSGVDLIEKDLEIVLRDFHPVSDRVSRQRNPDLSSSRQVATSFAQLSGIYSVKIDGELVLRAEINRR